MGWLKQMKDMKTMANAAPGLVQQGQALAAQAQQYQVSSVAQAQMAQAQAYAASAGRPVNDMLLTPINGVDLASYAWVSKQVANAGYNQSLAVGFANQRGITQADWERAAAGWAERMQAEPPLGREFRRHFDAA